MADRTAAPVTAEHRDPDLVLGPLDDTFAGEAERALADPPERARNPRPADVEPVHCRAYFKADLRAGKLGVLEVTMQIPWEYRAQAMKLLDLSGRPMELYARAAGRR